MRGIHLAILGGLLAGSVAAQQNPFLGAVPEGQATGGPLALTLHQAVERGLKHNLGAVLAGHSAKEARGERLVALSQLLPNINGRVTETSQQVNLAAFGFDSFPGIHPIIGPFGVFDTRATVSQTILNFRSLRGSQASVAAQKASELSYKDARDTVALVVTSLYLQSASELSRIEAVEAQVAAAQALYNQAVDFKKEGMVPGIDVLRAQVELQAQKQRLIAARNSFEKSKLSLGRAIGLPDGQEIQLTDAMPQATPPAPAMEEALARAYEGRMDYQSLSNRVKAAELSARAASAGYLPSVGFTGDYGVLGKSPVNMHGTFMAGVGVNIPIFQGGRVKGEVLEAQAALAKERAQLDNLRGQIAFELRSALLDLKSTAEQLDVNRSAVTLAKQQSEQARDRFAAGVTNNLEVVQAQEAVAAANENFISSLFSYNLARAQLARAMGGIEKNVDVLFPEGKQ
ncbi:MAG: TolC family protein [Acidobacteria bacterium]|nr:TolC family protein [Acidobacteriota bacterium]